ncbi:BON domain-containing protein [uncultured Phenylobacterium sp.]|uniref:BON domain-containing protein n=1 Tax=uncultured Phenylobacterium sp. TaxID=349273 RepID=UPI0025D73F4F|nr:BON domain-containing protein [uncultured Phenylobacterium sp.]
MLTQRKAAEGEGAMLRTKELDMDSRTLQDIVDIEVQRLGGGAPICAKVSDGVVTLSGAVQDDVRRIVIEQELLRRPEVLDVHNHLQVPPPMGDTQTQLLALLERDHVPAVGLQIEAEDGAVTLSGAAANWFDRDAAERLAWALPGVRSVENRIALPPGAVQPDTDAVGDPPA